MKPSEILDNLTRLEFEGMSAKAEIKAKYEFINSIRNPIRMDMEQRTDEWFSARLGVLSASTSVDAMSKTRQETAVNKNLAEMALQKGEPFPLTAPMAHGIESEDLARKAYEKKERVTVTELGFIYFNEDMRIGCSPDGLVDDDGDMGMVEFKCPNTSTHMGYIRNGCPKNYFYQIQQQMLVNGSAWCDFVSYDPRVLTDELSIYVQRIYRDEKTHVELFTNLMKICDKVDSTLKELGLEWDKSKNELVGV